MRTNYIIFQIRFHSLRKGRISIGVYGKYRAALRHIACAFGANIDLLEYNFLRPLSLVLYARISIAEGKYHAVRHIACAVGSNIDLHIVPSSTAAATAVPLPHKDCFAIGGRLVWVWLAAATRTSTAEGGEGLQRRATGRRMPMGAY